MDMGEEKEEIQKSPPMAGLGTKEGVLLALFKIYQYQFRNGFKSFENALASGGTSLKIRDI